MKITFHSFILLFIGILFICSCTTMQTKSKNINIHFARELALKVADGDDKDLKDVDNQVYSMSIVDLVSLKKLLLEVLAESPSITNSIAERWMIYSIVYMIDDILESLEYTLVVEGVFNWDRAVTLLGSTYLDFITDNEQQILIFTTVATVDKNLCYLKSEGRKVRLYIKEEIINDIKRNQVVKIEPVY